MPRTNYSAASVDANSIKYLRHRIKILRNVVIILLAIILIRLFFIQIIEHDAWLAKADEEHTLLETIVAKRGEIYMMDEGEPVSVVLNQTTYNVIIDPSVTDKDGIKRALGTYASDYTTADLDEVYNTEGLRYSIVAKNVPRTAADKIAEEGLSAVWFQPNNQRVYPEGEMASGLLGFVNSDGLGQYGVEGSFNDILSGKDGLLKATADVNKVALSIGSDNTKIPAEDGKNVVLTVDRGLQLGLEEVAANAVASTAATNAAAIVMDSNTSKVLAMVNVPTYNPGDYGNVTDASAYMNYVTDVPYEPASVCKNFAFSAAINEGLMTPETTYFNEGYEIIDGWKINNAVQSASLYGTIDMRTALSWSLNTGSIYALKLLGGNPSAINQAGREKLYDYYYNKFRLGQPTGIEIMEEVGFIPDPNEGWGRDSVYANMTFGQNLSLTMIQVATAFSAVINGGTYRTPTIIEGTLTNGELITSEHKDAIEDKILSDDTSSTMRDLLVYNRTSKRANGIDRSGYSIGGKSGTAQVIKNGAYDDTMSETVGTYIGFVGSNGELPKYTIMVKIWAEGQQMDGTQNAGSLFDSMSNYTIDYYKVQPK
ncbi:MAG: penicillin-binding transpeptidase domain-containing protein [Candidatus Saccharimonadaceae bacterium]|nr:penicillin-binding transpeptidase domain-containing protein [Candidatus Saccharimonadaceae bacterium]